MSLPQGLQLPQMQNTWATQLDPVISKPWNQGILIQNISLVSGVNVINHRLGRKLVGWIPTRVRAQETLSDQQDTNPTPELTLLIESSGTIVIDLIVF